MVIATLAAMISYYPRFRWRLMDEIRNPFFSNNPRSMKTA